MTMTLKMLALASAVAAVAALAQSVEVKTGPNGQLSGKAEAGNVSSSVSAGMAQSRTDDDRPRGEAVRTGRCVPGTSSRTLRVVSPDGSSSSSSSVRVSGGGTMAATGGGSAGSRVYEENCPDEGPVYSSRADPAPSRVEAPAR